MKIYARFDDCGLPIGFWNDEIYPNIIERDEAGRVFSEVRDPRIPVEVIEITSRQHKAFLDNNGFRKWQDGHVVPHQPPGPDLDQQWSVLRMERNVRLTSTDWTQVSDAPVDQAAWAEYRQKLRDLPETAIDPAVPNWPTPPE